MFFFSHFACVTLVGFNQKITAPAWITKAIGILVYRMMIKTDKQCHIHYTPILDKIMQTLPGLLMSPLARISKWG